MEKIIFKGKSYYLRHLYLEHLSQEVTVSTADLNDALMSQNGSYVSAKAETIDESIFYYVRKKEIKLKEEKLKNLLRSIT